MYDLRGPSESNMGTKFTHLKNCWKKNSVSNHHKNLQALAIEMYKMLYNMSPTILNIIAPRATPYNLPNPVSFKNWKSLLCPQWY